LGNGGRGEAGLSGSWAAQQIPLSVKRSLTLRGVADGKRLWRCASAGSARTLG